MRIAGITRSYPATKKLEDSVAVLIAGFAEDHNGWRGILVHPRCRLLRFETVTWSYTKQGKFSQVFDNGPDALRYGYYHKNNPDSGETDVEVSESNSEIDDLMDRIEQEWDKHFEAEGLYV